MIIIGHRGAKGLAPENTRASLQKGLEAGADQVEFDVRVTKDGRPILNHDPFILGKDSHPYLITHHTYAELRKQKPDLTTLDEALDTVNKKVPIIIEVKPHVPTGPVIEIIKDRIRRGWPPTDIYISSFSQPILLELQSTVPQIQLIVCESWSGIRAVRRARALKAKRLALYHHFLWNLYIRAMRRSGYQLYAYTLNNPKKARRWAKYGLAAVYTDFPNRFK